MDGAISSTEDADSCSGSSSLNMSVFNAQANSPCVAFGPLQDYAIGMRCKGTCYCRVVFFSDSTCSTEYDSSQIYSSSEAWVSTTSVTGVTSSENKAVRLICSGSVGPGLFDKVFVNTSKSGGF